MIKRKKFLELEEIIGLGASDDELVHFEELGVVGPEDERYPVHGFIVGSKEPNVPTLGLFGGVHGLEKVGTHVVLAYLRTLFKQMSWDQDLRLALSQCRIVAIPMVNPWGVANFRRSNGSGVDLMRNAPVELDESVSSTFLVSGHRYSSLIPWYRGKVDEKMEPENILLEQFVRKYLFESKSCLSIDFHSGFGMKDRLWYPYAKTTKAFPHDKQARQVAKLLDDTFAHHVYKVEQQADSYTIRGDMWDYLYDESLKVFNQSQVFIPWTLEMGSWIWVKKNPIQLFNIDGLFNPIVSHRYDRTMRRHLTLIDFFFRIVRNYPVWSV